MNRTTIALHAMLIAMKSGARSPVTKPAVPGRAWRALVLLAGGAVFGAVSAEDSGLTPRSPGDGIASGSSLPQGKNPPQVRAAS
jgi:hypothetical protein